MNLLSLRESFQNFSNSLPPVSPLEQDLCEAHFNLLQQWNEKINLVSRKSIGDAFAFHYADSLNIVRVAQDFTGIPYFDIGTGAGFPGMIFAFHYPDRSITLFEKSLKKQSFLTAAIVQLKLANVQLEGPIPKRLPKGFYFARAVFARDEIFHKLSSHLEKGSYLALTSGGRTGEMSFPKSFAKVTEIKYSLPSGAGDRRVEVFFH
jgi:16S rRNA (guanine527-N7)-methyltransferase